MNTSAYLLDIYETIDQVRLQEHERQTQAPLTVNRRSRSSERPGVAQVRPGLFVSRGHADMRRRALTAPSILKGRRREIPAMRSGLAAISDGPLVPVPTRT